MSAPKSFLEHLGVSPQTSTIPPSAHDSILIIIDAQNEYLDGLLAISKDNLAYSRPNILKLLERYRAARAPVVHIQHLTAPGASVFTPSTPLADIFPELTPLPARLASSDSNVDFERIVSKRFPGAFTQTPLNEIITNSGVRKVVLVGYMAHVCVSTTARQAQELGYDTYVVADAIGDRDIPAVEGGEGGARGEEVTKIVFWMVLMELADIFATVVKTEDVQ
ncbi:Isochorismatase-like protein, partial [Favolaschia claudopus]